MKVLLSCYKCGYTEFKRTTQFGYNVDNKRYISQEDSKELKSKVKCDRCGLEDYIENLEITFR